MPRADSALLLFGSVCYTVSLSSFVLSLSVNGMDATPCVTVCMQCLCTTKTTRQMDKEGPVTHVSGLWGLSEATFIFLCQNFLFIPLNEFDGCA